MFVIGVIVILKQPMNYENIINVHISYHKRWNQVELTGSLWEPQVMVPTYMYVDDVSLNI